MAKRSSEGASRFEGFADTRGRFFRDLAKHQDRGWFQAHRAEYEQGWVAPMRLLLDELRERLDGLYPRHALGDPKIFRIHRDVRFSKDKAPYKTHIGGYVPLGGTHGPSNPIPIYVQVGTETFVGAGHYMMEAAQLARYRAAVLDGGTGVAVDRMVRSLEKAGFSIASFGTLKKVPRGVDPGHPRAHLLKHKSLAVGFPALPARLLTERGLVVWLVKHAAKVRPLVEWLADLAP